MKIKSLLALILIFANTLLAKQKLPAPIIDSKPSVQIALLLDTSNSMDGLITQAKTQLWKVVNSFADAQCDGTTPHVEVALYEYGNNSLSAETNYIRQVQPFTRDLDEVSKQLFSLSTNGGEEYCGAVIQRSLADLQWNRHPKSYKVIFIAGNEPFTQGPISAHKACKDGIKKEITINTIHCGSRNDGIRGKWHDGAALAGGKFLIINQDQAVCHIDAPQDKKIAELNSQLNDTYIPYGTHGRAGKQKQEAADSNANTHSKSGAALQRAITKSTKNYSNASWDLIDAVKETGVKLESIDQKKLPEGMRNLTEEQLKNKLQQITLKRSEIQSNIQKLNQERSVYIAEERKKLTTSSTITLDEAIVQTTRQQAEKKGYLFLK